MEDLKNKLVSFNVNFGDIEKINPSFAKVKIYVCYAGKNRNYTKIEKEVLQKMIPSLYNIPIVGHYLENKDNFGGHDSKVEIDNQGFKIIDQTVPYGVVPSDTEIGFETIREKDGITEHEYLTCTGYLWYGRYFEPIEKILNNGANQSMEIMVDDGEYEEDGYYNIKDAYFSALCILGKDTVNVDNNVEPCFEGACITNYSLDSFKFQFNEMIQELKASLNDRKEDKALEENKIEEFQEEIKTDEIIVEEFKKEEITEEEIDNEKEEEVVEENQVSEDDKKKKCELCDEHKLTITSLNETINKINNDYSELNAKYELLVDENTQLKSEFEKVNGEYSAIKNEYVILKSFKDEYDNVLHTKDVEDVISKFDFTEEEIKDIKRKAISKEMTLEQLETNLYVLLGKKTFSNKKSFSKDTKKEEVVVLKVKTEENIESNPYGSASKYFIK